jgi:hypothetical protein
MATTKAELQKTLWRMRADLERFVAEAGPARIEEPGVEGDWSLKDVIAHLTAWRWWSVARMEGAQRNLEPAQPWGDDLDESTDENTDKINARFFERARKQSTTEALRDSRATFDRLEDAMMALPDDVLFEKGRFHWMEGYAAADIIYGTASHLFEDHELSINLFLARKPG